jgi:hypothetical protein
MKVPRKTSTVANALIQATIFKKCDRTSHRPGSNKQCANGTCQHTCDPAQVQDCAHKWTVRYSVNSFQREQSFATLTEAETFQLTLSTGKQTQGQMFTDPRAGLVKFLPLCGPFITKIARARPSTKATYRSNFSNPAVTKLLQDKSVVEVARMDDEVKTLLNITLGTYSDDYRGVVRRIITGTLDECVRKGTIPRHTLTGIELAPQIVTAEQYEARSKGMVSVDDETVRALSEGVTVTGQDRNGHKRTRVMSGLGIAPWLQRTMGLRIREALGVRKRLTSFLSFRTNLPSECICGLQHTRSETMPAHREPAPEQRECPRCQNRASRALPIHQEKSRDRSDNADSRGAPPGLAQDSATIAHHAAVRPSHVRKTRPFQGQGVWWVSVPKRLTTPLREHGQSFFHYNPPDTQNQSQKKKSRSKSKSKPSAVTLSAKGNRLNRAGGSAENRAKKARGPRTPPRPETLNGPVTAKRAGQTGRRLGPRQNMQVKPATSALTRFAARHGAARRVRPQPARPQSRPRDLTPPPNSKKGPPRKVALVIRFWLGRLQPDRVSARRGLLQPVREALPCLGGDDEHRPASVVGVAHGHAALWQQRALHALTVRR